MQYLLNPLYPLENLLQLPTISKYDFTVFLSLTITTPIAIGVLNPDSHRDIKHHILLCLEPS